MSLFFTGRRDEKRQKALGTSLYFTNKRAAFFFSILGCFKVKTYKTNRTRCEIRTGIKQGPALNVLTSLIASIVVCILSLGGRRILPKVFFNNCNRWSMTDGQRPTLFNEMPYRHCTV